MNVPANQIRTDTSKPVEDDGLKPYTIVIPAGRDWNDETIYSFMCADVAQRNLIPLSQPRFEGVVGAMIYNMQDKNKPIITPEIPAGQLRERGDIQADGKNVVGYEMTITPEMQRDFLSLARKELQNPAPAPELSEGFKENLATLDKQAAALQEKFSAINAWYQSKNTRHGLDGYTDYYLERADGDALALQNARNDAKNPNLLNSQTRLETGLSLANQRMDELFKDHRDMTPEQMVKRLNDRYEAGFTQAKQVSEIVGKIPGPLGAVGEFSINQLCNGLRLVSNDITPTQALAEFAKDGSKMVVSLAVKSDKADKFIDKAADFIGDTAVNVSKRVAEAEKSLKENPKLDRQEVMRAAITQGVGDATLNMVGKNLKLDKYGFSAGADAVKDFGVNLSKNLIEEYQNTNKKLAKEDRLDSGQLYKEGAARALINATTETFGKSIKGLGDGKGEREFLIDVATKLGLQEPVKQYLDSQKTLADPKKTEQPATVPQPVSRFESTSPGSVRDSQLTASMQEFSDARFVPKPLRGSYPLMDMIEDAIARNPQLQSLLPGDSRSNVFSALGAAAAKSDLRNVDSVVLSNDGTRLIAIQGDERSEFNRTASVAIQEAAKVPAVESQRQIAQSQVDTVKPQVESEMRSAQRVA